MKQRNNRVGIMGGTFNPIHDAHVQMALTACRELALDHVLVMPSSVPPHKGGMTIASADDRSNMIKLAIAKHPELVYSDFELKREGKTYTADTIRLLKEEAPDTEYYFIIGADSLLSIETWYHPERLLPEMVTVVFRRDNHSVSELNDRIIYLQEKYDCKIVLLSAPEIAVSSSGIRAAIAAGQTPEHLAQEVADYIRKRGLYR